MRIEERRKPANKIKESVLTISIGTIAPILLGFFGVLFYAYEKNLEHDKERHKSQQEQQTRVIEELGKLTDLYSATTNNVYAISESLKYNVMATTKAVEQLEKTNKSVENIQRNMKRYGSKTDDLCKTINEMSKTYEWDHRCN